MTLERAESTLSVIAFHFCFKTADEGATCLTVVDLKVVFSTVKTVNEYLVEGCRRLFEKFSEEGFDFDVMANRRRLAFASKLKEVMPDLVNPRRASHTNA